MTAIIEPGRFRSPRDPLESAFVAPVAALEAQFPAERPRVLMSHPRPEPMLGILRRLDGGPARTRALGFLNQGGTLDVFGMLFANRCTWAHAVEAAAAVMRLDRSRFLSADEILALERRGDPNVSRRA